MTLLLLSLSHSTSLFFNKELKELRQTKKSPDLELCDLVWSLDLKYIKAELPLTSMQPRIINGKYFLGTYKALLDTGASVTCIARKSLPVDCIPRSIDGCMVQGFSGSK